jgi:hypothetical protein
MTNYGFMDRMGVWFENFALPVVINECMMQSYNGTIRLFPNWPINNDAEFHNLRAAGAFLVSATLKNGEISKVVIYSEAGSTLKIILPWGSCTMKNAAGKKILNSKNLEIDTKKGEQITFEM